MPLTTCLYVVPAVLSYYFIDCAWFPKATAQEKLQTKKAERAVGDGNGGLHGHVAVRRQAMQ